MTDYREILRQHCLGISQRSIYTEARDVLEIIHARHKKASTIFCSQFAPAGWHDKFNEATIADAILDRIVHDSYTIQIYSDEKNDRSMREIYGINHGNKSIKK